MEGDSPLKAIMIMFDTLNRHMLSAYGCDWTHTPNFARLAERTVVFDNSYIGSMPCMPARRELHTGRYNFLHRSWGPLEPFDDSMPQLLRKTGVYTHLVTDHLHYWEDGGATYHTRYNTFDLVRGNQGDPWKGEVKAPVIPAALGSVEGEMNRNDWVNRKYFVEEHDFPQAKSFLSGMEFMRTNGLEDNWFLQIETFDPHEPFHAPQKYRDLYPHEYDGKHFDRPVYKRVNETPEEVAHCRYEYAALLSMCDAYLGQVMDTMDELDLWKDTMLIVNTDHGFLLGEHDWWGKTVQPFYQEVAHTPLFIWDPRSGIKGERRKSLVQTIDLAPTLLDYFGAEIPEDIQGKPLKAVIAQDAPIREAILFGIHGGHVNMTDGRYVYMRAPAEKINSPLFNYTLMPTHMRGFYNKQEMSTVELAEPFSFTKGMKTMKTASRKGSSGFEFGSLLFDLEDDYGQERPLNDPDTEMRLKQIMIKLMKESDAPEEQYIRLGLA
jgi:arylsulfatase A-like enzyme